MKEKNWADINAPWFEVDNFAEIIIDKINILDILDEWGIEYYACQSGEFTHKLKCPFPLHMNGEERTASCYVSQTQNKFFCFGCLSKGNVINFISLYTGRPYYESLKWLSRRAGIITADDIDDCEKNIVPREKKDPEKTILKHVYRSGILIREFLKNIKEKNEHLKWQDWADKRLVKLDEFVNNLADEDWEVAKKYYDKIENYLKNYSKELK